MELCFNVRTFFSIVYPSCVWWHRCLPVNPRFDRWCPHRPGRAGAEVPPLKTEKKFFQLGAFAHLIRFFRIEGISLTHFSIILFSLITS